MVHVLLKPGLDAGGLSFLEAALLSLGPRPSVTPSFQSPGFSVQGLRGKGLLKAGEIEARDGDTGDKPF